MPHDRRSRRVLLAMLGLAGVAMSVARRLARSSNLRTSAGPLPELAPAGELHPAAGGAAPAVNPPAPRPGRIRADRPRAGLGDAVDADIDERRPDPAIDMNPNAAGPGRCLARAGRHRGGERVGARSRVAVAVDRTGR